MERQHALDALRGFAAVSVAYSHLIGKLQMDGHLDQMSHLMYAMTKSVFDVGKASVLILFALSGYFIIHGLNRLRLRYEKPVTAFLCQRFFRLYPLYWFSLLLGVLFPWGDPERLFSPAVIALNATMLQGFFFVENVIGLYWTLQIELCFYFLAIALFLAGFGRSVRWLYCALLSQLCLALALAALRYLFEVKLPVALPLLVSVCLVGALWRQDASGESRQTSARYARAAVVSFYAFLLPICLLAYSHDTGLNETWYRYLLSYGAGMLIFLVATRSTGRRLAWLAPLGGASYIIFLLHPTVYAVLDLLGFHPASLGISVPLYMALALACVMVTAFFVKSLFVDSLLAQGERVTRQLAGARGTMPVPSIPLERRAPPGQA